MRRQDRRVVVGDEFENMHHDSREGFGANVGALDQPIGEEKWRHDRADAAEQSRQETGSGANKGKAPEGRFDRRLGSQVTPGNYQYKEEAKESAEQGDWRAGEEHTPDKCQRYASQGEPGYYPPIEFATVKPDAAAIADQLGDGQDGDGLTHPETGHQNGKEDGGAAEA